MTIYESELLWQRAASCRDADPRLFMPPETDDNEADDVYAGTSVPWVPAAEAKRICDMCPVRTQCLAWALAADAIGVWAGTSDYQRSLLTRKTARKKCPDCQSTMILTKGSSQVCGACGVSWFAPSG